MSPTTAIEATQHALMMVLLLAAPALIIGTLVGLVISILQAMTQVQDQMLTFAPKIIAILLALLLLTPWYVNTLISIGSKYFNQMAGAVG
ncbi:MAG: flagellar biosynthetic protein FliQ [Peptococcaceae bacterium]|nr:flagellar biosynthetic protein FliQ [Peptococcaceae bacterium]